MSSPTLGVIDASRFPLLFLDSTTMLPGDGERMLDDLETLIRHGKAFVLVIHNGKEPPDPKQTDGKARMLWLKENKTRLAAVCKGIISVVPDQQHFALVEKQTAGLRAALGIHFVAVDSQSAAEALAAELLADSGITN